MAFRIEDIGNDVTCYLDVEPNYHVPADGKGLSDAVLFESGSFGIAVESGIDSVVACSVKDAREFAEKILKVCSEIEGEEE